ncbi:MAG: hypothetical protein Q7T26_03385, partial [Dehalococcoidia bacterium]|nr:hypothetical protein [Dehalococcoidia bacterium]
PGVYHAYAEGLAKDLGWAVKDYRKVFAEVFSKGMVKVDWEAGLVFIPNAIKHNLPENPKVIIGWGKHWDELPQCTLKDEAYQHLKDFLIDYTKDKSESFLEAFGKTIRYLPVTATASVSASSLEEGKEGVGEKGVSLKPDLNGFGRFQACYPIWKAEESVKKAWKKIPVSEHEKIFQAVEAYKHSAAWQEEAGKFIPYPAKFLTEGRWKDKIEPMLPISTAAQATMAAGERLKARLRAEEEQT